MEAALERLARDRLHHPLDDPLARRRVHPGAVHGRHRRPAAPRVRRHHRRRDPGLGLRLAHADADAVQPLPAPAARERPRPRSTRPPSASSTACCALYERTLRWTLAPPRGRRWRSLVATFVVDRPTCSCIMPKGFIPSEDTGQIFAFTEAAQDISFEAMMAHQQAVADDRPPEPERRAVHVVHRRQRLQHRAEHRAHLHPAQAARPAAQPRTRSSTSCGPSWPTVPGIRVYPAESCRPSASAGSSRRACTSTRCRTPTSHELYQLGARCSSERLRAAARPAGRHQRPADHEPAGRSSTSTATRPRRSGVTAEQIETALYTAYGSQQVSTIYTPTNQYWVILELAAAVPARPDRAVAALRALDHRHAGAARRGRATLDARASGPLTVTPPRPAARR